MQPANGNTRGAFTLLEIMMAIAILVIICGTVYEFTATTMRAADFSVKYDAQELACAGFRRLLAAQLGGMPAHKQGALIGALVESKGVRRDAMQIVCSSGNALLTPDARGYYQITLDTHEIPRGSGHFTLGMDRQPWSEDDDDDDDDDDNAVATANVKTKDFLKGRDRLPADWVPLLEGVRAVEIAYFDARLNGWVDKWTDTSALPNLVRVRLTMENSGAPYEVVEHVPGGGLKAVIPTAAIPGVPNSNGQPVNGLNQGPTGLPINRPPTFIRPGTR